MYSFSGWNAATYIIGEMRTPQQNLPRALLAGTLIVLVLYVALNAVFLHTTPIDKLSGQLDVARIAGSYIFGDIGGRIVGAMICIGLVSSISAMMWIGPRVMMTMGEDIPALRIFARKSTQGAPAYAILFQLAVASLMLFTRSFEAVLDFIQFALLFCSFFTVLGVIKLRITQPDAPRPYRAWGYPITPLVFLLVTAFMMYYLLTERPLQSALGTLIMISGLLIYAVFRRRDRSPRLHPGPRIGMLQFTKIAVVAAAMLLAAALPARSADTVTANDTALFPGGDAAVGRFTADAVDPGPLLAAAREILRRRVRAARGAPAFEDPGLGGRQSGRAEADHVLHVLRPGLPLRRRLLFEGHDLCAERAGAAGFGARSFEIAARRRRAPRSTMSSTRWARS